ncbi:MAG: histidine kinase dimerization/phospho-acceptor domain-containing protein, partial [Pseudomonadota bacterium]|nr:histidine kinase dimerization/phospho-acceptor domain-containing protein [Pseudomonadota bacterium]
MANMNHELRTPLNAVLGFSETIRDERLGPLGNPKYQEYATHIHESGGYLLSFINDTIDIARMSFGHF